MRLPIGSEVGEVVEAGQPTFTHLGRSALDTLTVWSPTIEREQSYLAQRDEIRRQVLSLPTNVEGINMERLQNYAQEVFKSVVPVLFLDPENFDIASKVSSPASNDKDRNTLGIMLDAGVCIVGRDPELEDLNGTAFTESLAVHELAHGTTTFHPVEILAKKTGRLFKRSRTFADRKRNGFKVGKADSDSPRKGSFLEEGYADYERGQYVQRLGHTDGVLIEHPKLLEDFEGRDLGPHYWYLTPDGGRGVPIRSSLGASVLETLIYADPELLDALRASRYSVEGLRAVPKRLNRLQPGLYSRLQALDVETSDGLVGAAEMAGKIMKKFRPTAG